MGKVRVTRRKFLKSSLAAGVGVAVPLAGYSQFIEPYHLTVERLDLKIPNLPEAFDGFRIAQLSDFHYGTYTGSSVISAAVTLANSLQPDLTVITGDFVTVPYGRVTVTRAVYTDAVSCALALSRLSAPHGVLGCFGNHDAAANQQYVGEVFNSVGLRLLSNENHAIEIERRRLWIAVLDDAFVGEPNLPQALRGIPPAEPIIVLAHEPDLADEVCRYPVALQLSGHSHGGQIRLPLLGSLYLPPLAEKYPYGYYRIRDMHLYTNRGIGTILLPYRFNAPPEITLITLRH